MDWEKNDALQRELRKGETLLWSGQPRKACFLRPMDVLMIPFGVVWCGFVVNWIKGAADEGAPLFFLSFGTLFFLVGLYMIFGRFIVEAAIRRKSIYGLTNDRLIIISGLFSPSVRTHLLYSIPDFRLVEHSDGTGTIDFSGSSSFMNPWTTAWSPWQTISPSQFERIADARQVYEKILDLRSPPSSRDERAGSRVIT